MTNDIFNAHDCTSDSNACSPIEAKQILLACKIPKQAVRPLLLASKPQSSWRASPRWICPHTCSNALDCFLGSFEAALLSTDSHLVMFLQA